MGKSGQPTQNIRRQQQPNRSFGGDFFKPQSASLTLEDGVKFPGFAPSWQRHIAVGEVVFNTGMTGYVESLTDPSYAGQILVFTYPLIGNYGVPNSPAWESEKIQAAGVVTGWVSPFPSHWDSESSFLNW